MRLLGIHIFFVANEENTFKPFLIYSYYSFVILLNENDAKLKCIGIINTFAKYTIKCFILFTGILTIEKGKAHHFIVLFLFIQSLERLVGLARKRNCTNHTWNLTTASKTFANSFSTRRIYYMEISFAAECVNKLSCGIALNNYIQA